MLAVWKSPGGRAVATDQVLYNLMRRGIEWGLLPWLRDQEIPLMAYSPFDEGRLLGDPKLIEFAGRYDMTPAQVALAWLFVNDDVIAIPKTSRRERLRENVAAFDHPLTLEQLAELDEMFPPPTGPTPLEMI